MIIHRDTIRACLTDLLGEEPSYELLESMVNMCAACAEATLETVEADLRQARAVAFEQRFTRLARPGTEDGVDLSIKLVVDRLQEVRALAEVNEHQQQGGKVS